MKLFIIGNGFDLFHGFKTGYNHFKKYLKNNNCPVSTSFSLATFFLEENEDLWADFENRLDKVHYEAYGAEFSEDLTKERSDEDWDQSEKYNKALCDEFEETVSNFKSKLCRAVSDFVIDAVNHNTPSKSTAFSNVFSEKDLFVSFNYTRTLEKIYGIKREQILYLHGIAYPKNAYNNVYYQDYDEPSIIFGHGNEHVENDYDNTIESDPFNPHEVLQILPARLKKEYQIEKLTDFIKRAPQITELEIIGHGLGAVDQPYFLLLNKLISNLNSITYWYHSGDVESESTKKEKLQSFFPRKEIIIKYY